MLVLVCPTSTCNVHSLKVGTSLFGLQLKVEDLESCIPTFLFKQLSINLSVSSLNATFESHPNIIRHSVPSSLQRLMHLLLVLVGLLWPLVCFALPSSDHSFSVPYSDHSYPYLNSSSTFYIDTGLKLLQLQEKGAKTVQSILNRRHRSSNCTKQNLSIRREW